MPRSRPPLLEGLPPLVGERPRVLVLGSMPGAASLAARAYYAHPRNAFWPIVGAVYGFDPEAPHAERAAALVAAGVALWDVIGACRRRGSLDAAIDPASIRINPVDALLARHPGIERVLTNGGLASRLYARHLAARLPRAVAWHPMPSTSPANAGWTTARKHAIWRAALVGSGEPGEPPPSRTRR
jgi:hypoxanthine-DNA glycosylase